MPKVLKPRSTHIKIHKEITILKLRTIISNPNLACQLVLNLI